jgi:hypothetical protein
MPWHRLNSKDVPSRRDTDREHAARLPFLLDAELVDGEWADRCCWNVRLAATPENGLERVALLERASLLGRILITRQAEFLDDALFPPHGSSGVIVVGDEWVGRLDEFLVTIVGLLGPFTKMYQGVKAQGESGGIVTIIAPALQGRRVVRQFRFGPDGMPLTALQIDEGLSCGAGHREEGS